MPGDLGKDLRWEFGAVYVSSPTAPPQVTLSPEPFCHRAASRRSRRRQSCISPEEKEIIGGCDFFSVDGGDDIAQAQSPVGIASGRLNARLRRRASSCNIDDQYAGDTESLRDLLVGDLNAHSRPGNLSAADQFRNDSIHRIDGNGKADSGRRPRGAVNRGVDADQSAGAIEQRSARVSRIDRRIGLNHALNRPARDRFDLAIERADDTRR